jgi:transposase
MPQTFVGIDVSKAFLDVHVRPSAVAFRVEYDESGLAELSRKLTSAEDVLIVLEATAGLEVRAAAHLTAAGLPVAIVNPRQVRAFARAVGRLAKTDRIDAAVLAEFAERVSPQVRPLADEALRGLEAQLVRRRQLIDMIVAERNRATHAAERDLRRAIERHIKWLEKELDETDSGLRETIRNSPVWRAKDDLLRSAPGIGPATSSSLIGHLPQLGTLSGKQIAALAGLAPYNVDSGTLRGQRHTWGGRAAVRTAIYMATLVATRHNPVIREFYQRLRQTGKPPKVALIASARKFLVILNAMLREGKPWAAAPA